ncbi:hypothetical protein E2C01_039161 [Portunus trituberculatus]|uniref:Uncharacterized protein n=1 Tax=Portunus trituberculatus TaxID=210409 RepID=A0A5B7FG47_PORTR|nr:hypothetical protein [Portunus trituberculatus]
MVNKNVKKETLNIQQQSVLRNRRAKDGDDESRPEPPHVLPLHQRRHEGLRRRGGDLRAASVYTNTIFFVAHSTFSSWSHAASGGHRAGLSWSISPAVVCCRCGVWRGLGREGAGATRTEGRCGYWSFCLHKTRHYERFTAPSPALSTAHLCLPPPPSPPPPSLLSCPSPHIATASPRHNTPTSSSLIPPAPLRPLFYSFLATTAAP